MDGREARTEMVVYPLEFHRHSELQWKRRVKASMRSQRDDPSTTAATNVVQTAAFRSQHHLCPDTFPDASLNIIGCVRLASLVGPVVLIR
jgi:hypothetical protein